MKIKKEITCESITIGDRNIIITLELTTFSHTRLKDLPIIGFTLEPLFMKVVEGDEETIYSFKEVLMENARGQ